MNRRNDVNIRVPCILRLQPEIGGMFVDNMDLPTLIRWRLTCKTNYDQSVASLRRTLLLMLRRFVPKPTAIADIVTMHHGVFGAEFALAFILRDMSFLTNRLDVYVADHEYGPLCSSMLASPFIRKAIAGREYKNNSVVDSLRTMVSCKLSIQMVNGATIVVHCSYSSAATGPISRASCTALSNFVTEFGFGCSHPRLTFQRRALLADQELPYLSFNDGAAHHNLTELGFSLSTSPAAWPDFRSRDRLARRDLVESSNLPITGVRLLDTTQSEVADADAPVVRTPARSPIRCDDGQLGDEDASCHVCCAEQSICASDAREGVIAFDPVDVGSTVVRRSCGADVDPVDVANDAGTLRGVEGAPCPRRISPDADPGFAVDPTAHCERHYSSGVDVGSAWPVDGPYPRGDVSAAVDSEVQSAAPVASRPEDPRVAAFEDVPGSTTVLIQPPTSPVAGAVAVPLYQANAAGPVDLEAPSVDGRTIHPNAGSAEYNVAAADKDAGFTVFTTLVVGVYSGSSTLRPASPEANHPGPLVDGFHTDDASVRLSARGWYVDGENLVEPPPMLDPFELIDASRDGSVDPRLGSEPREVGRGSDYTDSEESLSQDGDGGLLVADTAGDDSDIDFLQSTLDSNSVRADPDGMRGDCDDAVVDSVLARSRSGECWRDHYICPAQGRYFGDPGSFVGFFDPLRGGEEYCAQNNVAPFGPLVVWRVLSTFKCDRRCDVYADAVDEGAMTIPVIIRRDPFGRRSETTYEELFV